MNILSLTYFQILGLPEGSETNGMGSNVTPPVVGQIASCSPSYPTMYSICCVVLQSN